MHDLAQAGVRPGVNQVWFSLVRLAAILSADYRWSHVRIWVPGEAWRDLERSEIWGFGEFLM